MTSKTKLTAHTAKQCRKLLAKYNRVATIHVDGDEITLDVIRQVGGQYGSTVVKLYNIADVLDELGL